MNAQFCQAVFSRIKASVLVGSVHDEGASVKTAGAAGEAQDEKQKAKNLTHVS